YDPTSNPAPAHSASPMLDFQQRGRLGLNSGVASVAQERTDGGGKLFGALDPRKVAHVVEHLEARVGDTIGDLATSERPEDEVLLSCHNEGRGGHICQHGK